MHLVQLSFGRMTNTEYILRESVKAWTVCRKTFAWPAGLVLCTVDDSLPGLKEIILAKATVFLHGLTIVATC
jgi:hypothetical protein